MIRNGRGNVDAIIEIVSPGNEDSRNAIRSFVEKAADILNQGVNLLVVDLFPPTLRHIPDTAQRTHRSNVGLIEGQSQQIKFRSFFDRCSGYVWTRRAR